MCLQCDGFSHEEVMQALDLQIRVHGWALVQVQGDDTAWSYTIGLVEHFGHPELTMIDVRLEYQSEVITNLVEGILANGELSRLSLLAERMKVVEVHPDHLCGDLFGRWASRYGAYPRPGSMLQILLPDDSFCECHIGAVRRLDRPGPMLPLPPLPPVRPALNRAERRRRDRRSDER
jgi:hypothetical protein